MSLIFRVNPPYQWLRYEGGRVEEFGEVASLVDLPAPNKGESIGVLDAELSSFHYVDVPAKNAKQLATAIPFALEETLTEDIDDLHFTVVDWQAGKPALVSVVAKKVIEETVQKVTESGVNIDQLIPELSLIPIHEAANATMIRSVLGVGGQARYLLVNNSMPPMVLDEDFLNVYFDNPDSYQGGIGVNDETVLRQLKDDFPEMDARHWTVGDSIKSWLEFKEPPKTNLLHSEYFGVASKKVNSGPLRWAAAFFLTAFLLKCLFDGYEYFYLLKENRILDKQMTQVLKESFPDLKNVIKGKERFIMAQRLQLSGGAGSVDFQGMLAVVASASRASNFIIDDMRFRSGVLNLTCSLADFSKVDELTKKLNQNDVQARLTSSSAEGGRVSAKYILKRKS